MRYFHFPIADESLRVKLVRVSKNERVKVHGVDVGQDEGVLRDEVVPDPRVLGQSVRDGQRGDVGHSLGLQHGGPRVGHAGLVLHRDGGAAALGVDLVADLLLDVAVVHEEDERPPQGGGRRLRAADKHVAHQLQQLVICKHSTIVYLFIH